MSGYYMSLKVAYHVWGTVFELDFVYNELAYLSSIPRSYFENTILIPSCTYKYAQQVTTSSTRSLTSSILTFTNLQQAQRFKH